MNTNTSSFVRFRFRFRSTWCHVVSLRGVTIKSMALQKKKLAFKMAFKITTHYMFTTYATRCVIGILSLAYCYCDHEAHMAHNASNQTVRMTSEFPHNRPVLLVSHLALSHLFCDFLTVSLFSLYLIRMPTVPVEPSRLNVVSDSIPQHCAHSSSASFQIFDHEANVYAFAFLSPVFHFFPLPVHHHHHLLLLLFHLLRLLIRRPRLHLLFFCTFFFLLFFSVSFCLLLHALSCSSSCFFCFGASYPACSSCSSSSIFFLLLLVCNRLPDCHVTVPAICN